MPNLKVVDRIALCAMLMAICAVPLASRASAEPTVFSKAQVLNDETFRSILPGMTASEVRALIGPPFRKIRFENTRTTSWDYRYRDTWGYDAELSVFLDDAEVVVGKFSSRTSAG